MRNDSRPVGQHSPGSPLGADERPFDSDRTDDRDTIAHGRQSRHIHERAWSSEPAGPDDPVTPQSDTTRRSKI